MLKISVIVPIYGVEKYLAQALDSLLNQTFQEIEFLLIDDGSKDNCPSIIDEYAKKDSRIKVFHKENGGYGQTCNFGIEKANGEYIAIFEPDDFIEPNMYEDLYEIAKKYDSDIVKSPYFENLETIGLKRQISPNWSSEIPQNRSFKLVEHPEFLYYHPSIWSCIYKKEFLIQNKIAFVEASGAGWSDNPFQVQTMCLANRINYINKAYYHWRVLNRFSSDDLKDYSIPFKRSEEIHSWLKEKGIFDKKILANLYKRELSYISIVLGMKKIVNKNDCFSQIQNMLARMNNEIVFDESCFSKKLQKTYKSFKNPKLSRIKLLLKRFLRSILEIRLGKKSKYILLFSKAIYYKEV
ncbi:MAG: glycosyltransferase [Candidatus Gastranaerophilales bacterium]|nr:glycosyltransferase [Candidatus Gastranaerophilales bacterium]